MKSLAVLLTIFFCFSSLTGCATFGHKIKRWMNGEPKPEAQAPKMTKYSETGNYANPNRRKYQRTTRESLEKDSRLDDRAGSLWVMEGQGAYLFAQNIVRMIGDPVNVLIEGEPKEQLEAKSNVIRKLLAKLEKKANAPPQVRGPAAAGAPKPAEPPKSGAPPAPGGEGTAENAPEEKESEAAKVPFSVKTVPTRITEKMVDGNYRVKGAQSFMIGKREYKVIVTGIIRAEDFDESGVSAGKLLDSSFDIVSQRKGQTL